MVFISGVTVVSCAFFIAGTYIDNTTLLDVVEAFFALIFALDFVMSLLAAPVRGTLICLSFPLYFQIKYENDCLLFPRGKGEGVSLFSSIFKSNMKMLPSVS